MLESTPSVTSGEISVYLALVFSAVFYGIYLLLFLISAYCLEVNAYVTLRQRRFYHAFGFVVLLLNTYFFISRAAASLLMWIIHRDYPGGPLQYFYLCSSFGWFVTGNIAQSVANLLTDLLLTYRCYIIYGSQLWVALLPLSCSIVFIVLYIVLEVYQVNGGYLSVTAGTNMVIASNSMTIAANIIVTFMISLRLYTAHKQIKKVLDKNLATTYTGVAAIFIESALPFCILGIIFCITMYVGSVTDEVFELLWYWSCAIAPQVIILRIALGHAWNKNTLSELMTKTNIEFGTLDLALDSPNTRGAEEQFRRSTIPQMQTQDTSTHISFSFASSSS